MTSLIQQLLGCDDSHIVSTDGEIITLKDVPFRCRRWETVEILPLDGMIKFYMNNQVQLKLEIVAQTREHRPTQRITSQFQQQQEESSNDEI